MTTKNRRVATYLPPEIYDLLKAFISERGLKGESPALIEILAEYFGVVHPATQKVDYSGFVRIEQFQELADKVFDLEKRLQASSSEDNLLGKLPNKMRRIAERLDKVEAVASLLPSSAVRSSPDSEPTTVPGQMGLPGLVEDEPPVGQGDTSLQKPSDDAIQPLNGHQLSKRFGIAKDSVSGIKRKKTSEAFLQWTKEKDPDGIAWQFNSGDKLYHPVTVEEEF
jgi:hypothetical protein